MSGSEVHVNFRDEDMDNLGLARSKQTEAKQLGGLSEKNNRKQLLSTYY